MALLAVAEVMAALDTTPHLVHFSSRLPHGGGLELPAQRPPAPRGQDRATRGRCGHGGGHGRGGGSKAGRREVDGQMDGQMDGGMDGRTQARSEWEEEKKERERERERGLVEGGSC